MSEGLPSCGPALSLLCITWMEDQESHQYQYGSLAWPPRSRWELAWRQVEHSGALEPRRQTLPEALGSEGTRTQLGSEVFLSQLKYGWEYPAQPTKALERVLLACPSNGHTPRRLMFL